MDTVTFAHAKGAVTIGLFRPGIAVEGLESRYWGPNLRRQFALSIPTNRQEPQCQTRACILGQFFRKPAPSPPPAAAFRLAPKGLRSQLRATTSCGRGSLAGSAAASVFMKWLKRWELLIFGKFTQ